MKWNVLVIGLTLFSVYTLINYYIGHRGATIMRLMVSSRGILLYWILFWIVVNLYIGARFLHGYIPAPVDRWMIHVGSYWMAAMIYFLMIILAVDALRFLFRIMSLEWPGWITSDSGIRNLGITMLMIVMTFLFIGSINARHPRITRYQLHMPVESERRGEMTVALVSDIHLGTIIRTSHLEKLVNKLNQIDPEIILFAGDIIDENVNHFIDENMDEWFLRLDPPLGKYAVLGNHEYFGGHTDKIVHHLETSNIRVLRDEGLLVDNLFYLAGREDLLSSRYTGQERRSVKQILEQTANDQKPVILMDHQPKTWDEAITNGVWLQLSGHTHRGQFFPFGFITEKLFPEDWGIKEQNGQYLVVSSGYGTWGPPVRLGNHPEIVLLQINY